jgi:hypothetical protein
MQLNINIYKLANKLDKTVWRQYDHKSLQDLSERIQKNLDGELFDLPNDFLSEWKSFMNNHGHDGEDQLFVSSLRYLDTPVFLLARPRDDGSDAILFSKPK